MQLGRLAGELRFYLNRFGEKLWVKPLVACVLSIFGALMAKMANETGLDSYVPKITGESVETLLSIMASSMLVIATLAVGSMVAAYSSASTTASPRAFPLVLADDVSQFALSAFIGTFIFSLVGLIATQNSYYDAGGHFVLFSLTVLVFTFVIFTFVTWIDRIARLGRLGTIVSKVAEATGRALTNRKVAPYLGGIPLEKHDKGQPIYTSRVGYLQHIDVHGLQALAEKAQGRIAVAVLPGACIAPDTPLAYLLGSSASGDRAWDDEAIADKFQIGSFRTFDEDPRYGFVVLSQIASRALSPAVNDPGTAIDIIVENLALFSRWQAPLAEGKKPAEACDRVMVPSLETSDLFDDAFTAIGRDGAGSIEVASRLQKAFGSLNAKGDAAMQAAAAHHARRALALSNEASLLNEDRERLRELYERMGRAE
ncbi:DUF2254 domain-containing protein [Marinobacter fonticola]|uniref:DUF2254 domain-containing protein n=1 Tax=Marinobacter fonticola TaxID=2603215 RepID=UPI0011E74267|nr:DUF2254 domain-containing protein [Marinobacter fonticola]